MKDNRRLYLCSYDVADDKRRDRLFDLLSGLGEHVQYSVFLCELTPREHASMIGAGSEIIHQEEDQLLVLNIGPSNLDWPVHLRCVGRCWTPLVRSSII